VTAAAPRAPGGKRNGRTRVLIATDQVATRTGVRLALEQDAFCIEADSARAALDAAVRDHPDVCLIDVDMGGGDRGIEAAAAINQRLPQAAIVMLAHQADVHEFFESLRAGASGYLSDEIDPARLPFVVRGVLAGEAAVPRKFVTRLIDELRVRERRRSVVVGSRHVELTPREWEVLELLRRGLSTREMSAELRISGVTVRRHISMLMRKLGVGDRKSALALLDKQ
jgi:DNA-binding NarL/FixJ family response regulator